jgi:hypothetical protein
MQKGKKKRKIRGKEKRKVPYLRKYSLESVGKRLYTVHVGEKKEEKCTDKKKKIEERYGKHGYRERKDARCVTQRREIDGKV